MPLTSLAKDDSWFKQLFELSPDPIWIIEGNRLIECNEAAVRMLGYTSKEALMDIHPSLLSPPRQPDGQESFAKAERMMEIARAKGLHRFEWIHIKADKSEFVAEITLSSITAGERQLIYCVWRDITERKRMEEQIRKLAFHDQLTGLPNRRLLNDRLGQVQAAGRRGGHFGALMLIDLDNFKPLNDTHGHAAGDQLLIEVARRLKGCVREMDTVARFGGDEFVVLLSDLSASKKDATGHAEIITEKIRVSLAQPYPLTVKRRGKPRTVVEHRSSACIGVTLFRDHEVIQEDILKRADAAMYEAKRAGRDAVRFSPPLPESDGERVRAPSGFVHLAWRPAYECGIAAIDEQHSALFADANALLGAILAGAPASEAVVLIDALLRDIEQHFRDEEAILESAGFPGAAEHAVTHRQLVASARELADHLHAGILTPGEIFQFLAHELIARHFLGADRLYLPYLAQKA